MNSPATALPPGRGRLALIVAGVLALLGSFVVAAPAQAGYYGEPYYGSNPCSYHCGYPRYYAPHYYHGCSPCGCYRHCGLGYRSGGVVYERRYVEREYVVRRYGYGGYHHHYGCYPYGGYGGGCHHYGGYYPYGGYRRPWGYGYGYGGVGRRWPTPFYGYQPTAETYEDGPPRPPAPVYGGPGYEADPYGYEN
jgi:hypothetical protein